MPKKAGHMFALFANTKCFALESLYPYSTMAQRTGCNTRYSSFKNFGVSKFTLLNFIY